MPEMALSPAGFDQRPEGNIRFSTGCIAKTYCIVGYSDLDINIVDNGDGTVSIYYKVKDAGEYTVSIKFGGQPVSGGFYTFTVSASFTAKDIFPDFLSNK